MVRQYIITYTKKHMPWQTFQELYPDDKIALEAELKYIKENYNLLSVEVMRLRF